MSQVKPRVLYHLSFNKIDHGLLVPQIPKDKDQFENDSIERICFSESVAGCLCAISDTYEKLESVEQQKGLCKCYLYTIEIPSDAEIDTLDEQGEVALLSPEFLSEHHYVYDALATHEWWSLRSIKATEQEITITAFNHEWVLLPYYTEKENLLGVYTQKEDYPHLTKFIQANENLVNKSSALELICSDSQFWKEFWKCEIKGEFDETEDDIPFDFTELRDELVNRQICVDVSTVTSASYILDDSDLQITETLHIGTKDWVEKTTIKLRKDNPLVARINVL